MHGREAPVPTSSYVWLGGPRVLRLVHFPANIISLRHNFWTGSSFAFLQIPSEETWQ